MLFDSKFSTLNSKLFFAGRRLALLAVLGFVASSAEFGLAQQDAPALVPASPAAGKVASKDADDDDEEKKERKKGEVVVETVVEGLNNPFAVAIQPETGHVFVSESGAGRVIRVVKKKIDPVITDFPLGEFHNAQAGPLGLLFFSKDLLAVGGAGQSAGEETIATYKVPEFVKKKKKKKDEEDAAAEGGAKEGEDEGDESKEKEGDEKESEEEVSDEEKDAEGDDEDGEKKEGEKKEGEEAEGEEAEGEEAAKPGEPITADKHEDDPLKMTKSDEGAAGENFAHMIKKHTTVFIVADSDPEKGWVATAKATEEGKLSKLAHTIPTVELSGYASPSCLAISPEGKHLVVSQMGDADESADSQLTFYSLKGKLLQNFEIPLHDISAFAYSPQRKHLFAADISRKDPSKGALVKLIGAGEKCTVKEIQKMEGVTSMAFNDSGDLYVTVLGDPAKAAAGTPNGKLLLIKGLDETPEPEEED